jgi:hypothetical protein
MSFRTSFSCIGQVAKDLISQSETWMTHNELGQEIGVL